MAPTKTLVVVLAGGAGGRLELLTEHRAKPAVPVGGVYRLIDVPLTNASHAGIRDVWVIEQFHPTSIQDHLANGRPWDLDRTRGGLLTLHPERGSDREGWHQGTADALWRQAELLRQFAPQQLVVVSADAVYQLDYDRVVREHAESGAELTMVTTRRPKDEASRYGVVGVADDGRVVDYAYKPDDPATDLVTTEVFVFRPEVLLEQLEKFADQGLEDLGHEVLPALVDRGGVREHRLDGYWRDLGTVAAYHDAHLQFTQAEPPIRLDDPAWPMLTANAHRGSAWVGRGATVVDSMLAPSVRVAGSVERCVLSPGAVVEAGAEVVDSVLLGGAVVRAGARVRGAVLDADAIVESGCVLGEQPAPDDAKDEVVVIGTGVRLAAGTVVGRGARIA